MPSWKIHDKWAEKMGIPVEGVVKFLGVFSWN